MKTRLAKPVTARAQRLRHILIFAVAVVVTTIAAATITNVAVAMEPEPPVKSAKLDPYRLTGLIKALSHQDRTVRILAQQRLAELPLTGSEENFDQFITSLYQSDLLPLQAWRIEPHKLALSLKLMTDLDTYSALQPSVTSGTTNETTAGSEAANRSTKLDPDRLTKLLQALQHQGGSLDFEARKRLAELPLASSPENIDVLLTSIRNSGNLYYYEKVHVEPQSLALSQQLVRGLSAISADKNVASANRYYAFLWAIREAEYYANHTARRGKPAVAYFPPPQAGDTEVRANSTAQQSKPVTDYFPELPQAAETLIRALSDLELRVRASANFKAYLANTPELRADVERFLLSDAGPVVRVQSIARLGPAYFNDTPELRKELTSLLLDPEVRRKIELHDYGMRQASADTLIQEFKLNDPRIVEFYIDRLESGDSQVRHSTLKVLSALGPAAKAALPMLEKAHQIEVAIDGNNEFWIVAAIADIREPVPTREVSADATGLERRLAERAASLKTFSFSMSFYSQIFSDARRQFQLLALAPGILIDPNGTVLTSKHLVEAGGEIVTSGLIVGSERRPEVIAPDIGGGLALVRLTPENYESPAIFANSQELKAGDAAFIIPWDEDRKGTMSRVTLTDTNVNTADADTDGNSDSGPNWTYDLVAGDAPLPPEPTSAFLFDGLGHLLAYQSLITDKEGQKKTLVVPAHRIKELAAKGLAAAKARQAEAAAAGEEKTTEGEEVEAAVAEKEEAAAKESGQ